MARKKKVVPVQLSRACEIGARFVSSSKGNPILVEHLDVASRVLEVLERQKGFKSLRQKVEEEVKD
jgi:hypothetical protein